MHTCEVCVLDRNRVGHAARALAAARVDRRVHHPAAYGSWARAVSVVLDADTEYCRASGLVVVADELSRNDMRPLLGAALHLVDDEVARARLERVRAVLSSV